MDRKDDEIRLVQDHIQSHLKSESAKPLRDRLTVKFIDSARFGDVLQRVRAPGSLENVPAWRVRDLGVGAMGEDGTTSIPAFEAVLAEWCSRALEDLPTQLHELTPDEALVVGIFQANDVLFEDFSCPFSYFQASAVA